MAQHRHLALEGEAVRLELREEQVRGMARSASRQPSASAAPSSAPAPDHTGEGSLPFNQCLKLRWPSLLPLLPPQKLRMAAEKRASAANEQVQHLAAQLEDVQTVSMARMLADRLEQAEADVGQALATEEEEKAEQAQQDEQQRENDAEVRFGLRAAGRPRCCCLVLCLLAPAPGTTAFR